MDIKETAKRLVELNKKGNYEDVYKELYVSDALSVENWSGKREEFKGLPAIHEKVKKWQDEIEEIHSLKVSDPLVADKSFAVTYTLDATKKNERRQKMTELAVYRVNDDGMIYHEEFCA